ncbi:MAG TPA: 4,5-DOPA dioxygenase extradiol, partial [Pyrinomonadaceae bacterium]
AILAVSAHWYIPGTFVTAMGWPRTIHDFGGFPAELYQVKYNAPGSPVLAARVKELLAPIAVGLDHSWGLDHGTWSVLVHIFPQADVPVVQLSIDETQPAEFHYELAQHLQPLRDEDVLIIGSGNLVHNLHAYAWGKHVAAPFDWAISFEEEVMSCLLAADHNPIIHYETLRRNALLAVPTPEHYLPLIYVIGLRKREDQVTFPVKGIDGGSVSMLSVQLG